MKKAIVAILVTILVAILPMLNGCGALKGKDGTAGADGSNGSPGAQGPAGTPGQNAIISSGAIGSRVDSNGLSACHHDYEFQQNHWLIFRHRKNGTSDQGEGSTGFDLWNVDIMDFLLISEVGNVTYCSLHFDQSALTLKYTVNYASEGKQGETGTIDLMTGQVH